ncbi:TetR/AcrR family transcriptional regulator [Paenibacillaceae bacterium WGS1546]|uniref:TetR/AcrR family transcriptional regulator n=1 Tax=Cohnella sp. WGS1546 TaxID=3366810 RepID=UPI00372D7083
MARYSKENSIELHKARTTEIITAAMRIFAEHGIDKSTMSKIAKEIGISKGLMYHYFTSKDEILDACVKWAVENSEQLMNEVRDLTGTSIEKIVYFTKVSLSQDNQIAFRVIQRAIQSKHLKEDTKKIYEKSGSIYIDCLLPIFKEGQRSEEIVDADPLMLLEFYLTVISGLLMEEVNWTTEEEGWNIRRLIRIIEK